MVSLLVQSLTLNYNPNYWVTITSNKRTLLSSLSPSPTSKKPSSGQPSGGSKKIIGGSSQGSNSRIWVSLHDLIRKSNSVLKKKATSLGIKCYGTCYKIDFDYLRSNSPLSTGSRGRIQAC